VRAKRGEQEIDIAVLEVVGRLLDLVLVIYVAIRQPLGPHQVVHAFHALQIHREALQTVGDLAGDRLAVDAANLLEIGKLGDFHPVQPHLPAQPPGAERRIFPVILDKAHVVLFQIESQRFERAQIQLQNVRRRRLQHHLELVVMLQAVRVVAIAAVLWAATRLNISGLPRLGAERAQKGRGVRGARADFHVVRLQQRAAALGPVALQGKDGVLKGGFHGE